MAHPTILHTGDIVVLKVRIQTPGKGQEEAFLSGDGLTAEVGILPVDSWESGQRDIRDFLFEVVCQLGYAAQRDMQKIRKQQAASQTPTGHGAAPLDADIAPYEERAAHEAQQNIYRMSNAPVALSYGDVIQLLHVKSQKFVLVRGRASARHERTARLVQLMDGTAAAWLRLMPFYRHKVQGEPVLFGEQAVLQAGKLGGAWKLHWTQLGDPARGRYEVNCSTQSSGFFIQLFNRDVITRARPGGPPVPALRGASMARMYFPQHEAFVAASNDQSKTAPFCRALDDKVFQSPDNLCSKTLWIIEPTGETTNGLPIRFGIPVRLRHYASLRYLCAEAVGMAAPAQSTNPRTSQSGADAKKGEVTMTLKDKPGLDCQFMLEPTEKLANKHEPVPKHRPRLLVRWENSPDGRHFWLHCTGKKKGKRHSLLLAWSATRFIRDAMTLEITEPEHQDLGKHWMTENDVVMESREWLQTSMIPFIPERKAKDTGASKSHERRSSVALGQAQSEAERNKYFVDLEKSFQDMILFLTDSFHWRKVGAKNLDALKCPKFVNATRQRILRELKFPNVTFDLYHALTEAGYSVKEKSSRAKIELLDEEGSSAIKRKQSVKLDALLPLETRVLKLLVKMWMYCFLDSRECENYFEKNGWMETINNLNGLGLGAAEVFQALVDENPLLVRHVDLSTVVKFVEFIRTLGPDDTWLNFLYSLCAPQGNPIVYKQQSVLGILIYAGSRASQDVAAAPARNRQELLFATKLGDPTGASFGTARDVSLNSGETLGSDIARTGGRDISVAWNHPAHYVLGRDVLYHGPQVLSLPVAKDNKGVSWVSLVQLAWVLEPDTCYEQVMGRSYDAKRISADKVQSRKLEAVSVLAKFMLAQLRLFANMSKKRQYNCILTFQEEYSFSLCLSGFIDMRLPTAMRAVFADLIGTLWIDRHPHSVVTIPELMRAANDLSSTNDREIPSFVLYDGRPDKWSDEHGRALPADVLSFYGAKSAGKFDVLVQALWNYICKGPSAEHLVHSETDTNHLMISTVNLIVQLFNFGFVYKIEKLNSLLQPLLRCLNGRTDWLEAPKSCGGSNQSPESDPANQRSHTPLLHEHKINANANGDISMHSSIGPTGHFPPIANGQSRYVKSQVNKIVNEAKFAMCRAVVHMTKVDLHIKIDKIVIVFGKFLDGRKARGLDPFPSPPPPELLDAMSEALAGDVMAFKFEGLNFPNVMFMDLMMYDDNELFGATLELLLFNCLRTVEVFDMLKDVQLLEPHEFEQFMSCKRDAANFGNLIFSMEIWCQEDNYSEFDQPKVAEFKDVCGRCIERCSYGAQDLSPTDIQNFLRSTDFAYTLVSALGLDRNDFQAKAREIFMSIMSTVCQVASQFVEDHTANQLDMFKVGVVGTGLINPWLEELPSASCLLASVFSNNMELCLQVPEDLIQTFLKTVSKTKSEGYFKPELLSFFCSIVNEGTRPVLRNQALVIHALQQAGENSVFHLLTGTHNEARRLQLIAGFRSTKVLKRPDCQQEWASQQDAELMYHMRSIEVCSCIALGSAGAGSLVNKPYINSIFPMRQVMQSLINLREHEPNIQGAEAREILFVLKSRIVALVRLVLYDSDRSLLDLNVLQAEVQMNFFTMLTNDISGILTVGKEGSNSIPLRPEEAEYLKNVLHAMDVYFHNAFPVLKASIDESMLDIWTKEFAEVLLAGKRKQRKVAPEDNLVVDSVQSFLSIIRDGASSSAWKQRIYHEAQVRPPREVFHPVKGRTYQFFESAVDQLRQDPRIAEKLRKEKELTAHRVTEVGELTNPEAMDYINALDKAGLGSIIGSGDVDSPQNIPAALPDGFDFRRNKLGAEEVVQRMVAHCISHFRDDRQSLERVLQILTDVLGTVGAGGGEEAHSLTQIRFARAGAVTLVVLLLDSRLSNQMSNAAWTLAVAMLVPYAPGGSANKTVQHEFGVVCQGREDSGMWAGFEEFCATVGANVKGIRELRNKNGAFTPDDQDDINEFDGHRARASNAINALRLMVESHFVSMQHYSFFQAGNFKSCNVAEISSGLLSKLCKDPEAGDLVNHEEVELMSTILKLLRKMMEGPFKKCQEFLSSTGLVEAGQKILSASFSLLTRETGDRYPPVVRKMKAELIGMQLAMLECRPDTVVHQTVLHRVDAVTMKSRIVFLYLYFVFDASSLVGSGTTPLAAEELSSPMKNATAIFNRLSTSAHLAITIMPEVDEHLLQELFAEGFGGIQLLLQLVPFEVQFETLVLPQKIPFKDDHNLFATEKEYLRERQAYHQRSIYCEAFEFFRRFIKSIEVVVGTKLQRIHFPQPMLAAWYVHMTAKNRILQTVPIESPDNKVKVFVAMCREAYDEAGLIMTLCKFSIFPEWITHSALGKSLPHSMYRPFAFFLNNDSRNMRMLDSVSVIMAFILAILVSLNLVPLGNGAQRFIGWDSVSSATASAALGGAYVACGAVSLFLTAILRMPLVYNMERKNDTSKTVSVVKSVFDIFSKIAWRLSLILCAGTALLMGGSSLSLYSLLIMDIFFQNDSLHGVVQALTQQAESLIMVTVGSIILTYGYAVFGFYVFQDEFGDYCNESVLKCTENIAYQGTRMGIVGLSGMMTMVDDQTGEWTKFMRLVFDSSYFMVMGVILLNTVVALIVDAFSSLRAEQQARRDHLAGYTFISSIDRKAIEAAAQAKSISDGFEKHQSEMQPTWDYLGFIFLLEKKTQADFTGPETLIRRLILEDDVAWLPLNRSMLLEEEVRKVLDHEEEMDQTEADIPSPVIETDESVSVNEIIKVMDQDRQTNVEARTSMDEVMLELHKSSKAQQEQLEALRKETSNIWNALQRQSERESPSPKADPKAKKKGIF